MQLPVFKDLLDLSARTAGDIARDRVTAVSVILSALGALIAAFSLIVLK